MLDEKILAVLRRSAEGHVSSEELCKLAGISRAAIWKHIEKLRQEGYEIEASPHLGYRLIAVPDRLIPSEVKWALNTKIIGKEILSYKKVDSTNDVAYKLAEKGMKEGCVIFAEEQERGKGRHGRNWLSPPHTGIYLSFILRPEIAPNEIARITLLAAVCVAKAIRGATGLSAMIKWPNDIIVNGRKICGILTEMKAEQDRVDFLIVGIGVNVGTNERSLPKGASSIRVELRRAGRTMTHPSRLEIARRILEEVERHYIRLNKSGFKAIMDDWKHLSSMPGSRIKVAMQTRSLEGIVHDIDENGALIVRLDSGILEAVSSGDIIMVR
jgi:BirA family biotin operon repressor/biotin-[acetyl-CoA-carboxylase] ligase